MNGVNALTAHSAVALGNLFPWKQPRSSCFPKAIMLIPHLSGCCSTHHTAVNTGIQALDAQLMVTREQIRMTVHWLTGLDLLLGISCKTRRLPGLSPTGLPSCGHSIPRMFSMLPHMYPPHHLQCKARRDRPEETASWHKAGPCFSPQGEPDIFTWARGQKGQRSLVVREQGSIYSLSFLVLFTWVLSLFFSVNLIRGLSVLSSKKKQLFIFILFLFLIK